MALFNFENEKLNYIKEVPFKLEKEIQNLCEKNMQIKLFHLHKLLQKMLANQ